VIYKILSVADWEAAQAAGRFDGSADDRRDGFIHFSDRRQVIGTAAKYYSGQSGLVLLTVDVGTLADLRWEKSRDDALFPHLYGPLELDAVERIDRLPDDREAAGAIAELLGWLPQVVPPPRAGAASVDFKAESVSRLVICLFDEEREVALRGQSAH
jgi:uncharacterized protein (DUF952 family)